MARIQTKKKAGFADPCFEAPFFELCFVGRSQKVPKVLHVEVKRT
jgi:hypothetical protein